MIPKCYYCCLYALCPLSGLQPPQPVVWWDEGRIRGLACLQGDFFRRIGRESEVTEFGLWAVGFKLPNHADYFVFYFRDWTRGARALPRVIINVCFNPSLRMGKKKSYNPQKTC